MVMKSLLFHHKKTKPNCLKPGTNALKHSANAGKLAVYLPIGLFKLF